MGKLMCELHQPTEIVPQPWDQEDDEENQESAKQIQVKSDSSIRRELERNRLYEYGNCNDQGHA